MSYQKIHEEYLERIDKQIDVVQGSFKSHKRATIMGLILFVGSLALALYGAIKIVPTATLIGGMVAAGSGAVSIFCGAEKRKERKLLNTLQELKNPEPTGNEIVIQSDEAPEKK